MERPARRLRIARGTAAQPAWAGGAPGAGLDQKGLPAKRTNHCTSAGPARRSSIWPPAWSSGGAAGTMGAGRIGLPMETRVHTHTPPPRRVLRSFALLLALLVSGCLAAAAAARPTHAHHTSSCGTSHHTRHSSAKRCSKHHAGKGTHQTRKPAPKPAAPAPKLTPASCEDGTAPVRVASGDYNCEDGSEPACIDGSDPILPERRLGADVPRRVRRPRMRAGLESRMRARTRVRRRSERSRAGLRTRLGLRRRRRRTRRLRPAAPARPACACEGGATRLRRPAVDRAGATTKRPASGARATAS